MSRIPIRRRRADSNLSATSGADAAVDAIGTAVLLDFLIGDSLADIAGRHRLRDVAEVEVLLRSALLRYGYAAQSGTKR